MSKQALIDLGKSRGRRTLDRVEGFATSVGPDSCFKGTLTGAGHCIVYGRVEGNCEIDGTLVIAESGVWMGDIIASNVLVAGQVVGTLVAHEKMEIISSARILGKLTSRVIAIAEGAVHDGEVQMGDISHFADRRDAEPAD